MWNVIVIGDGRKISGYWLIWHGMTLLKSINFAMWQGILYKSNVINALTNLWLQICDNRITHMYKYSYIVLWTCFGQYMAFNGLQIWFNKITNETKVLGPFIYKVNMCIQTSLSWQFELKTQIVLKLLSCLSHDNVANLFPHPRENLVQVYTENANHLG